MATITGFLTLRPCAALLASGVGPRKAFCLSAFPGTPDTDSKYVCWGGEWEMPNASACDPCCWLLSPKTALGRKLV